MMAKIYHWKLTDIFVCCLYEIKKEKNINDSKK